MALEHGHHRPSTTDDAAACAETDGVGDIDDLMDKRVDDLVDRRVDHGRAKEEIEEAHEVNGLCDNAVC